MVLQKENGKPSRYRLLAANSGTLTERTQSNTPAIERHREYMANFTDSKCFGLAHLDRIDYNPPLFEFIVQPLK